MNLDFIFNTHHHNDHVGGNLEIKGITGCKIIGPEIDKKRIPGIDIGVKNKERIRLGESNINIYEIPGHTTGHICFYFPEDSLLFCGDTLFSMGCGRMFEGTAKQMWNSLKILRSLPDDTLIYCGHEYTESNAKFAFSLDKENEDLKEKISEIYKLRNDGKPTVPSILGEEKKFNPFLKSDDPDFTKKINIKSNVSWKIFKEIRRMKDSF